MTRGRAALRRALATFVALTAIAAGASACSSSGSGSTSAPTRAGIESLLRSHAKALLAHDQAAYMAGFSTDSPSSTFVTGQSVAYDNLVQLPLASWSYGYDVRTDDRSAERAASTLYGSPAWIVHVDLRYALRGIDREPVEEGLYLTFIRQHGAVVIAGDSDLTDAGGASWRGPWDYGPLTVVRGARSIVLGHPAQAAQLPAIAADVDAAIPKVTAVWGTDWPQRVAVLVPATDDELASDAGPASEITSDVPALTVSAGNDDLTRAALGVRLIVNPVAFAGLTDLGRGIVLRHEITHAAASAVTSDSSPRWLIEGFADYVGQLDIPQSVTTTAAELTKAVRAGAVPTALPVESAFNAQATAAQAYEASWLACRLIAKDIGQAGLVRFYRAVGESYDSSGAVSTELRSLLHLTPAQFTARWRAYILAELG